jgi:ATP-dependent Clp protease adapter protein ClpS
VSRANSSRAKTRSSKKTTTPRERIYKLTAFQPDPALTDYIDAMLKAYVVLTREEARAVYRHAKDIALPNGDYAITLQAMKKLGEAE